MLGLAEASAGRGHSSLVSASRPLASCPGTVQKQFSPYCHTRGQFLPTELSERAQPAEKQPEAGLTKVCVRWVRDQLGAKLKKDVKADVDKDEEDLEDRKHEGNCRPRRKTPIYNFNYLFIYYYIF